MRSRWTILAAAAATFWVAPQLAAAEQGVEDQLRQMNDRMAQMEQQLQATNEELSASKERVEAQQGLIQDLDVDRQASSGLSKFLSETEFSGLVAASYTYNFKGLNSSAVGRNGDNTTGGENLGIFGLTAPQHSNSNNFQVDQLAFRMKKTSTPESRAGWGASVVWGASADQLAGRVNTPDDDSSSDASGDLPELFEAYASYLWDIGGGVKSTVGRYATPVGAESFFENENFDITRGLLWTLQPHNHTGANWSGDCECGLNWQLGASNSYGNTMSNQDTKPTFVGSVGYKKDTVGAKLSGVYGGDVDDLFAPSTTFGLVNVGGGTVDGDFASGIERNTDKIGLLDAVLTWDPSDKLSTWVNFDYYWTADSGNSPGTQALSSLSIYGIAAAGRYAFTEQTGFSLRYEWLALNDLCGSDGDGGSDCAGADASLMSLTATVDHHLTDALSLRAEARWDRGRVQDVADNIFLGSDGTSSGSAGSGLTESDFDKGSNHQVLGLVQLMYEF